MKSSSFSGRGSNRVGWSCVEDHSKFPLPDLLHAEEAAARPFSLWRIERAEKPDLDELIPSRAWHPLCNGYGARLDTFVSPSLRLVTFRELLQTRGPLPPSCSRSKNCGADTPWQLWCNRVPFHFSECFAFVVSDAGPLKHIRTEHLLVLALTIISFSHRFSKRKTHPTYSPASQHSASTKRNRMDFLRDPHLVTIRVAYCAVIQRLPSRRQDCV